MCRTRRRRGGRPSCPSGHRARWPPRRRRRAGGERGEGEGKTRRTCRGPGSAGWCRCVGEAAGGGGGGGGGDGGAAATARGGWRGGAEPERRAAPCPPPHPKQNPLCPVGARRAWAMCLLALVHWTPVLPAGRPFPPVPPVRIFLAILPVLLRHNFLFSRMEKVTWSLMLILLYSTNDGEMFVTFIFFVFFFRRKDLYV